MNEYYIQKQKHTIKSQFLATISKYITIIDNSFIFCYTILRQCVVALEWRSCSLLKHLFKTKGDRIENQLVCYTMGGGNKLLSTVVIAVIIFATVVSSALVSPKSVRAATAPNTYSRSWYVFDPTPSTMKNLGAADGTFDHNNSNQNSLVVLDFGQVSYDSGTYGTYHFGSLAFISDAQILLAAESYASGWWNNAGSYPTLELALGTSNNQECPYGGSCTTKSAGIAWSNTVLQLQSYLQNSGMSSQINAYGADDIETEWDSVSKTEDFVNGYNSVSNPENFMDYGDDTPGYGWSTYDVYEVSWGIGWDVPLPEIYVSGQVTEWSGIYSTYHGSPNYFQFWGIMTECAGNPGSTGLCSNPNGEYTPYTGWWALRIASGVGSILSYATNILHQTGY